MAPHPARLPNSILRWNAKRDKFRGQRFSGACSGKRYCSKCCTVPNAILPYRQMPQRERSGVRPWISTPQSTASAKPQSCWQELSAYVLSTAGSGSRALPPIAERSISVVCACSGMMSALPSGNCRSDRDAAPYRTLSQSECGKRSPEVRGLLTLGVAGKQEDPHGG